MTAYETVPKTWDLVGVKILIRRHNEKMCLMIKNEPTIRNEYYAVWVISNCLASIGEMQVTDMNAVIRLADRYAFELGVSGTLVLHNLYEQILAVNPELSRKLTFGPKQDRATEGKCAACGEPVQKRRFADVTAEEVLTLADRMKKRVIGQDHVIDPVAEAIEMAKADLKNPRRPKGSFLLIGPTGVGKTLIFEVLFEELIKTAEEEDGFICIDCPEYCLEHDIAKLIGAPPGYIMSDKGGLLTNHIAMYPFSVVLFDEIEKAHQSIYNLQMKITDKGMLTDSQGNKVSLSEAIIGMTSNVGVKEMQGLKALGFGARIDEETKREHLEKSLFGHFNPEWLGRLDGIFYCRSLAAEDYLKIVDLELALALKWFAERRKIEVSWNEDVKQLIYANGTDTDRFGARPITGRVERLFSKPLSKCVLRNDFQEGDRLEAGVEKEKIIFERRS